MIKSRKEKYRANGKLLITGEYTVLKGAKALAIPLKYGQELIVTPNHESFFKWKASTVNGVWFEATYDGNLNIQISSNNQLATNLSSIIKNCINHRPDIIEYIRNKTVQTHLEFNKNWGWGSSSTLISCLAQWLGVNPYLLLQDSFGGSGYDIACATATSPLVYRLNNYAPEITPIQFSPSFKKHIYFVYSGKKQNSQNEVKRINNHNITPDITDNVNVITEAMLKCSDLNKFGHLIERHERIISNFIQRMPIKQSLFPDFDGYIKSLGAWGGDFMMAVTEKDEAYVKQYFCLHQLNKIFKINDIIL